MSTNRSKLPREPGSRRNLKLAPSQAVPPARSPRVPRLVAVLVAAAGTITLLSAAISPIRGRVEVFTAVVPLAVRTGATSIAALAGFGTLLVAGGLARRQRSAWWIAVSLLAIAGVTHLLRDVDVPVAGLSLGLAAVLITTRSQFDARVGRGSLHRALLALPLWAGAAWFFAWGAIVSHSSDLEPRISAGRAAWEALKGSAGFALDFRVAGSEGRWIPGLLPLLGVVVVVVSIAAALRPVVEGLSAGPQDHDRVRAVVRRYGTDTLSYFTLREDKSYFFWGEAVIAYRYVWNLGLMSGDPVGPPDDARAAVQAFVAYARRRGWGVAALAAGDELAPLYGSLGLRSFYLGDEAVLDPTRFSLEGRAIRKVRQSCHRLERSGYTLEMLTDDRVGPDLQDTLNAITSSWRGRAPERGFTMALGRLPSPRDHDALTVVGRDGDGRAQGYLHLVPCYGERPGFSVDAMRRRPESRNGLMEWMVAETALELRDRGIERLSLNFSLLGGLFEKEVKLSLVEHAELALARRLNRFFQIERLRDFNAKFFPEWVPRYIFYEAPLGLPRVALAYLEAEAFLRLPLIGLRRGRRTRV